LRKKNGDKADEKRKKKGCKARKSKAARNK